MSPWNPLSLPLDTDRIAIIGPGRLGTAFAYKFARENKKVIVYYHDVDVCKAINREHLNPRHLTEDLARRLGGSSPPTITSTPSGWRPAAP